MNDRNIDVGWPHFHIAFGLFYIHKENTEIQISSWFLTKSKRRKTLLSTEKKKERKYLGTMPDTSSYLEGTQRANMVSAVKYLI